MRYDLNELLRNNPYPGRGIMLGCSAEGSRSVMVYFIMGRSVNSRNRVFERTSDGIRTKARDPALMTDPSLVIYHPVRAYGGRTIVTNGDQTDTIFDFLQSGRSYYEALQTREFEPDAPNYTPRISGLIEQNGSYCLSILKTTDGCPASCLRNFFENSAPVAGLGHFISTYRTDGDPLPSFAGEPIPVSVPEESSLEIIATSIWDSLNEENKVSLYARETEISTGKSNDIIINKMEVQNDD